MFLPSSQLPPRSIIQRHVDEDGILVDVPLSQMYGAPYTTEGYRTTLWLTNQGTNGIVAKKIRKEV